MYIKSNQIKSNTFLKFNLNLQACKDELNRVVNPNETHYFIYQQQQKMN